MKSKKLLYALIFMLVGCNNSLISNQNSISFSNQFSNNNYSTNITADSENQNTVVSSSKVNISSQSTDVSLSSSSSKIQSAINSSSQPIEIEKGIRYEYHPLSEPSINEQLVTFNPMGELSKVWNHYRGDNILVAVIDSGFDYNHPEFINRDGTSKVSEKSAYIYTANNKTSVEVGKSKVGISDGDSHGTMCAGLLGASVNGTGISGIAPNVDLMLIKIDKHALSMAEAFKYAANNGARVISTSLGAYPNVNGESSGDIHFPAGLDLSTVFNNNINYAYNKGVSIVAATGNSRTTTLSYPAGCDNVIGAGGLNAGSQTQIWDNGYEGSNYNGSKTYVDIFAPSDGIYAPGFDTSTHKSTYWDNAKGTSFSAPLIAGAIAMYYQKYPTHSNKDLEQALQRSCINISSYNGNKNMGLGRLDVGKLLNINEDVKEIVNTPSTQIEKTTTKLTIIDEEGWDLRTLHVYDFKFEKGYGYAELDNFFSHYYGPRIKTASYQKEGTTKGYAYTDEGYIGDYYLCIGNNVHAQPTQYEYIFPWWVKGFSYQVVNNSNWLPEGGNKIDLNNGYGKDVRAYFWYDSSTNFGVTQVVYNTSVSFVAAIQVTKTYVNNGKIIKTEKEINSIYDYLEMPIVNDGSFKGWYLDIEGNIPYQRDIIREDITIYGIYS